MTLIAAAMCPHALTLIGDIVEFQSRLIDD
jgi:hypothetical protein